MSSSCVSWVEMFKSLQANKNQVQLRRDELTRDLLDESIDHQEERAWFKCHIKNEEYKIEQINRDLDRMSTMIIKLCSNPK
jgi:hypothetical protein